MTSPGDDYGDPPGLGDQADAETRRLRDFLRGGRNGGYGPWNRTPGGCGSNLLAVLLVVAATVLLVLYVN